MIRVNNRDHCRAVRLLLGQKPNPSLHSFMDDFSKQLGWGHRLLRHNIDMVRMAGELYGEEGEREATFHIACDMGWITSQDVAEAQAIKNKREEVESARDKEKAASNN